MTINEKLQEISIVKVGIFIIALYITSQTLRFDFITDFLEIALLLFFIYELRGSKISIGSISLKQILTIVILNIFFSYGMLYLTDFVVLSKSIIVGSVLNTIFIAPIVEELLFRGVIFNNLNKYYSVNVAIIFTSLLFGLSHELGGIISSFVFGICMNILYIKTSNIMILIIAHFTNNLISQIIYYMDFSNLIFTNTIIITIISILAIVSACILFDSIFEEMKGLN